MRKKEIAAKITPPSPSGPLHSPPGLSREEIDSYYEILSEEITDYDCGTLCAPLNEGVPFCCSTKITLPLLYRSELAFLQKKGDLWSIWNPESSRGRRLLRDLSREEVYCQCRGVAHCIRAQRSISCRTYPLEPYIDEKGRLAGLVFVRELTMACEREKSGAVWEGRNGEEKQGEKICPLTKRREDIRQKYIDSSFRFWQKFLRIPVEYETYRESSRSLRKREARTGERSHIFYPL